MCKLKDYTGEDLRVMQDPTLKYGPIQRRVRFGAGASGTNACTHWCNGTNTTSTSRISSRQER